METRKTKISRNAIESLGLKYVLHSEEDNSDYTFNIDSNKIEGYKYCLVWQPETDDIIISHHKKTTNIEELNIVGLYRGKPNSVELLEEILESIYK